MPPGSALSTEPCFHPKGVLGSGCLHPPGSLSSSAMACSITSMLVHSFVLTYLLMPTVSLVFAQPVRIAPLPPSSSSATRVLSIKLSLFPVRNAPPLKERAPSSGYELDSNWSFIPDVRAPQQLPLVLAGKNGALAFGQTNERDTYRVFLTGADWSTKSVKAEPEYIKDSGDFDVLLDDPDKCDFIRSLRQSCMECRDLAVVWALFPPGFEQAIGARLQRQGKGRPSIQLEFDSTSQEGVSLARPRGGKK